MFKYVKAAFVILYMIQFSLAGSVQRDLALIIPNHPGKVDEKTEHDFFTIKNVSEIKTFATGLIKIYQLGISSQDKSVCNFYPSCSRFTTRAIDRQGLFAGGLLGADRLMRCHRYSKLYYPLSYEVYRGPEIIKLYDPVEKYIK